MLPGPFPRPRAPPLLLIPAAVLLLPTPAWAQEEDPDGEGAGEVVVEGSEEAHAAMDRRLDEEGVERCPASSSGELLRAMPGLHLTSLGAAGGGWQAWVRGFDVAHGADLLVTVEGVPLNEVSNIVGHGYLDLHLVPADAVMRLDLRKGNDRPSWGNFAVVGSADYQLGLPEAGWTLRGGVSTDLGAETLVAWRPRNADTGTFVMAQVDRTLGWNSNRDRRHARLAAGFTRPLGWGDLQAFVLAYDGTWEWPGVLRSAEVEADSRSHYGTYGLEQGGDSRRALVGVTWEANRDFWRAEATGYVGGRWLRTVQNWTGFYEDPVDGDGRAQAHQALQVGARTEVQQAWELLGDYTVGTVGAEVRADVFAQFAEAVEPDGTVLEILDRGEGRFVDLGGWTSVRFGVREVLDITPALRVDWNWLLDRDLLALGLDDTTRAGEWVLQPKLSAAVRPIDEVAVFAAYGRSFRSQAVDQDSMTADATELGVRASPTWWLDLQASAYGVWVGEEQVFDPGTGRSLLDGPTRRLGVEAVADIYVFEWLEIQVDGSATDARSLETGDPVPYAPRWLVAGAIYARDLPVQDFEVSGGLRAWMLGSRPLPHGYVGERTSVVDLTASARRGAWTFGASIENLFANRWKDGEFAYASWWNLGEERSEEPQLHFTAGTPFTLTARVERRL